MDSTMILSLPIFTINAICIPSFFSTLMANLDNFIKDNFGKMLQIVCNTSIQIGSLKSITETTILNLALSPRIDIVKKAMSVAEKKEPAFEELILECYFKIQILLLYVNCCHYLKIKPKIEINVTVCFL